MANSKLQPEARRPENLPSGRRARELRGQHNTLVSHTLGAMPIINHTLKRMRLRELLQRHLPPDDERVIIPTADVVLLLVRNLLVSREPLYGVTEWAADHAPWLFGFTEQSLEHLQDDRVGRGLDRLFQAMDTGLVMSLVAHVTREFKLRLDELHNDSTTITFFGDYVDADGQPRLGRPTPAITWGHNKDHRPDLKQLLYILTVTEDGGVPVYFQAASGNITDDNTHQATWEILRQLVGSPDFLYVADCKLATTENLEHIANHGGRFISVLPATRKENKEFRKRLVEQPESITWSEVGPGPDEDDGQAPDVFRAKEVVSREGFRLLWYQSSRKQATDAEARFRKIQRAEGRLAELRSRLLGPRTRFRQRDLVAREVESLLRDHDVAPYLEVEILEREEESFRQASPGRPSPKTKYVRSVKTRFDLRWTLNALVIAEAARGDGVFPLITNADDLDAAEVLRAYKRQPAVERRFSNLKTNHRVAPVFLRSVTRVVGLLLVSFFALMTQALLERQMRQATQRRGVTSLPLYPEGRPCSRPTARLLFDLFETLSIHTLPRAHSSDLRFATELPPVHRRLLDLLGIPTSAYFQ